MAIHVYNHCWIAPEDPLIMTLDFFKVFGGQERANSGKSRCIEKCSSFLAGPGPLGLFTLSSCVRSCVSVCVFAYHALCWKMELQVRMFTFPNVLTNVWACSCWLCWRAVEIIANLPFPPSKTWMNFNLSIMVLDKEETVKTILKKI